MTAIEERRSESAFLFDWRLCVQDWVPARGHRQDCLCYWAAVAANSFSMGAPTMLPHSVQEPS